MLACDSFNGILYLSPHHDHRIRENNEWFKGQKLRWTLIRCFQINIVVKRTGVNWGVYFCYLFIYLNCKQINSAYGEKFAINIMCHHSTLAKTKRQIYR